MAIDGKVIIEALLDTKKAEMSAHKLGTRLKGGLTKATKATAAGLAAAGAAATATAGAVVKATKATMEYGVEVNRNSQKLNISRQSYQEWAYVLKRSGSSIDTLKMGMKKLSTQIDEAKNGTKTATENFKRLGISVQDLQGKTQEEVFSMMIKRLQGIKDTTERSAIANKFFGRSAQELNGLLNRSGKEVSDLKKQAHDLGLVLSDDAISKTAEFRGKLTELQSAFEGLRNKMAIKFLPALTDITDGLSLIVQGKEAKGLKKIEKGVDEFIKQLNKATPVIIKIGGKIIKSLGKGLIDNLPSILKAGSNLVVAIIRGIIKAIPVLVKELPKILKVVKDAFFDLLDAIKNELPNEFKPLINAVKNIIQFFGEFVKLLMSTSEGGQMLRTVIVMLTGAYVAYKVATTIATIATEALTAAMDTNPILLCISAIGGLVAAMALMSSQSDDSANSMNRVSEEVKTVLEEQEKLNNSLDEGKKSREQAVQDTLAQAYQADILWGKLKDLNEVEHKSKEQKKEMKDLVKQLNELYPDLHLKYDKEKDKLNQTNSELKRNIDLMKQKAFAKAYTEQAEETISAMAKVKAEQKKLTTAIEEDIPKAIQKARDNRDLAFDTLQLFMDKYGGDDFKRLKEDWVDWGDALEDEAALMKMLNEGGSDFTESQKQDFIELWNTAKLSNESVIDNKKALEKSKKALNDNDKELEKLNDEYKVYQDLIGDTEATEKAIKKLDKMAKSAKGSAKKTIKNIQTQLANGEITVEEASQKLVEAGLKGLEKDKKGKKTSKKAGEKGDDAVFGWAKAFVKQKNLSAIGRIMQKFVKNALDKMGKAGKEGSPWKTTEQKGQWAVEGFVKGIKNKQQLANKAMANLATSSVNTLDKQLLADSKYSTGYLQSQINTAVDVSAGLRGLPDAVKEGFEDANVAIVVDDRVAARFVKGVMTQ